MIFSDRCGGFCDGLRGGVVVGFIRLLAGFKDGQRVLPLTSEALEVFGVLPGVSGAVLSIEKDKLPAFAVDVDVAAHLGEVAGEICGRLQVEHGTFRQASRCEIFQFAEGALHGVGGGDWWGDGFRDCEESCSGEECGADH